MSKILKKVLATHRPHIAARLTKESGYDEKKHLYPKHLHEAGIINKDELADLDGCIDDAASTGDNFAAALRSAMSGELNEGKLNSDAFIKNLMALDPDGKDGDEDDDMDGDDDSDKDVTSKSGDKVTA